jgi:hypothetical protein
VELDGNDGGLGCLGWRAAAELQVPAASGRRWRKRRRVWVATHQANSSGSSIRYFGREHCGPSAHDRTIQKNFGDVDGLAERLASSL